MAKIEELKKRWFLELGDDGNPLKKRHPGTELNNYSDDNKIEMLINGNTVMEHFHSCVEKMIRFMEEHEKIPNPPQIWIANLNLTNVELLGPKHGGKAYELILKAAQKGIKVYLLNSGFGKFWKIKQKKFIKRFNKEECGFAAYDSRNPLWGVHHQKFYVCLWPSPKDWLAVVSSADFDNIDWDTSDHSLAKSPTHQLSLVVRGPAVRDIALTFAERWNDGINIKQTFPQITTSIPIDFLNIPIPSPIEASHSVQVLRTYPIHIKRKDKPTSELVSLSYSWSYQGEFTIWGAYLQAIKRAKYYIYIEDQYFSSLNCPPVLNTPEESLYDLDLVYQLGKALERNVDVIVLVPEKNSDNGIYRWLVEHQKFLGIKYLYNKYNKALSESRQVGNLLILMLNVNDKPVIVHSKLMIVDDEFVLAGTANIGSRSMTFDSEIHLGIVDEKETFAKEMRLAIWKEHLQLTEEESDENNPASIINKIKDPKEGVTILKCDKGPGTRRLRPINDTLLKNNPNWYCEKYLMKTIAQPYAGPRWNKFE